MRYKHYISFYFDDKYDTYLYIINKALLKNG